MRHITLMLCMLVTTSFAQAQAQLLTDQEQSCITAATVVTSLPYAEIEGTVIEEGINFSADSYYARSREVRREWLRLLKKTDHSLKAYPKTIRDIQTDTQKADIALRSDDTEYLNELFARALDCLPAKEALH